MFRNLLNILRIGAGIIILLFGIIGLFVPIMQGWILILIAVPLISPEHGKRMVIKLKEWKEKISYAFRRRNSNRQS